MIEKIRQTINRHFPNRIVKEYALVHEETEEIILTRREMREIPTGVLEQRARQVADDGWVSAAAWIVKEAGLRRGQAQSIVGRALIHHARELSEEIADDILQTVSSSREGRSIGGELASNIGLYIENQEHRRRLLHNDEFGHFSRIEGLLNKFL